MVSYYSKKFKIPFDEVVTKITNALQQQGFGSIHCMDVKQTLSNELHVDFRNYKILAACIPEFVYKAVSLESHIGIMLPCNILIQEHENGEVEVSAVNPMEVIDRSVMNPTIEEIALEVSNRLRMVIDHFHKNDDVADNASEKEDPILWTSEWHFQEQYF